MPRKYKCCYCKKYTEEPTRTPRGRFCDLRCVIDYAKTKASEQREKAIKAAQRKKAKKHAQRKREFYANDRSTRVKAAQKAFNDYIRERDKNDPCISCGRYHQGQNHAGHYRSVGSHPELRFEPLNCHLQCSVCNNHKSGLIAEYRINLIKKIGLDNVEWLEGPHDPKKYTVEELKEIEMNYKNYLKMLRGN